MEDSLKGGDFGSAAIRKANNDVKSDFDKNQGAMAILTAHLTDCISRLDNSLRARSTEIPAPCKVSFESGVYWTD